MATESTESTETPPLPLPAVSPPYHPMGGVVTLDCWHQLGGAAGGDLGFGGGAGVRGFRGFRGYFSAGNTWGLFFCW